MAKLVVKASQASQLLAVLAKEVGGEITLNKAIARLNLEPKKDVAVVFVDSFGNIDVKPV
jgi:hypothetical protein